MERKWSRIIPLANFVLPKANRFPRCPFTGEQRTSILGACDAYTINYGRTGQSNAVRLRHSCWFLRYTGLRIGGCRIVEEERLTGNRCCFTHRRLVFRSTCQCPPLWCKLCSQCREAVAGRKRRQIRSISSGLVAGLVKTAVADWQRALRKLSTWLGTLEEAGKPNGHAHRFTRYVRRSRYWRKSVAH